MITTFLCVHDFALIKDMIEQVHAQKGIMMAGVSTELPKNTRVFHEKQVDVLVLDCSKHCAEALLLSRQIYEDEELHMRIIYLFKEITSQTLAYLLQREKHPSYIEEPFTLTNLLQQMIQETPAHVVYPMSYKHEESFASQIMQNMGLPVHLYGFAYIKSSAILLYQTHAGIQLTMKQIYKEVARIHETTASRVEKSIRTAIDYAYRIAPQLIGIQGIKPTNSQLIHLICERVLLHELDKKEGQIL